MKSLANQLTRMQKRDHLVNKIYFMIQNSKKKGKQTILSVVNKSVLRNLNCIAEIIESNRVNEIRDASTHF